MTVAPMDMTNGNNTDNRVLRAFMPVHFVAGRGAAG